MLRTWCGGRIRAMDLLLTVRRRLKKGSFSFRLPAVWSAASPEIPEWLLEIWCSA